MNDAPISPIMGAAALVGAEIRPGITELSIILNPFVLKTLHTQITSLVEP